MWRGQLGSHGKPRIYTASLCLAIMCYAFIYVLISQYDLWQIILGLTIVHLSTLILLLTYKEQLRAAVQLLILISFPIISHVYVCLIESPIEWKSAFISSLAIGQISFLVTAFRLPITYKESIRKKVVIIGDNQVEIERVKAGLSKECKVYEWNVTSQNTFEDALNIKRWIVTPHLQVEEKKQLIKIGIQHNINIELIPDFYELVLHGTNVRSVEDTLTLSIKKLEIPLMKNLIKYTFDFVVSSILLIITSPLFITLLILIPITSKGPAIYIQERLGKSEKPFFIYKFRSMVQDAEKCSGPTLSSKDDPRLTKLGRFIRATRMDELPQLINVLKGDMSLVGPRPERAFFVKQFATNHPEYKLRMNVKPGITGYAQVKGTYHTSAEDKLRYDLMYIQNYTLIQDIKILLMTCIVIFNKQKSS
ncbi:sugar transferase [Bacillus sp. HMF5848]|uniref:sugar transferase n=1 Tax=Bacillus sp. HMF5848 TaxID=2495421 RepID=UPI000F7A83AF|nr:sugar transferase [Bacillus sp. HMF5848]RSK28307.1 sugar transferase [Bacillus sp. HMF5848]